VVVVGNGGGGGVVVVVVVDVTGKDGASCAWLAWFAMAVARQRRDVVAVVVLDAGGGAGSDPAIPGDAFKASRRPKRQASHPWPAMLPPAASVLCNC